MATKMQGARQNRRWLNVLLIITSSVFTLILAEVGLRVYFYRSINPPISPSSISMRDPHPTRGWCLTANKSVWLRTRDYTVQVETNSRGFRDVAHELTKPPDTFRIVVLGDSFMEAYQVAMESSFPRLLERYLEDYKVEVINLGVGGYGTVQEYITLLEEGILYAPDLVLLGFLPGNDIRNNSSVAEKALKKTDSIKTFGRPFASINSSGALTISQPDYERSVVWVHEQRTAIERSLRNNLLKRTILYEIYTRAVDKFNHRNNQLGPYNPNIWLGAFLKEFKPEYGKSELTAVEYQHIWQNAWVITVRMIREIEEASNSVGASFALFTIPMLIQVEGSFLNKVKTKYPELVFDVDRYNRQLDIFCETNSLQCKDLVPAFRTAQKSGGTLYYEIQDDHWNERGHDLAAREISVWLVSNFIPRRFSRSPEKP